MPLTNATTISKTLKLGAWDMLNNPSHSIQFNVSLNKFTGIISTYILGDDGQTNFDFNSRKELETSPIGFFGSISTISTTFINVNTISINFLRADNGIFDSTLFNSLLINRGFVTVQFLP